MPMTPLRRRAAALTAGLLSAALVLTACGGGSDDDDSTGGSTEGYPVTIDTAYGEITLDEKPEKIVVLSVNYVDMLAAIDERPIAFSAGRWTDEAELVNDHPWLEGHFESDQFDPSLLSAAFEVSLEAVAAHEPDLIVGTIWQIPEEQYQELSKIAPTYVGREADSATDWEDSLTDLGVLTGKSDEAAQAITDVEEDFSAARDRLPGLQGKTYNSAVYYVETSELEPYGLFWIERFGMVPAENQPAAFASSVERISLENLEQLDAEVLVVMPTPASGWQDPQEITPVFEADPRFSDLPASENEAVLFIDLPATLAGSVPGPLSTAWLVEQFTPQLESFPLNDQ